MSLHHFFLDDQVLADEADEVFPLRLSADDRKHAKVLRLAAGEHVSVVDAARDYFECEIVQVEGGDIRARISQRLDMEQTGPDVILVQGIAKGEKMDDVIRHATEVGVAAFIPMASSRCVVKLDEKKAASRVARWRAIAKSAAMQSGRLTVPEVGEPMSVKQVAEALSGATCVLVCWEECPATSTIADAIARGMAECAMGDRRDARIAVVVGPEGGLSADEVDILTSGPRSWPVTLGPTILRTETAGVVAPALVLYECGGMGAKGSEEK